ncbi:terminal uridylyltransferase 7-like isoform X5 [Ostrea edulis]|nr:terminal uridylyltransferase 7-like isoform X5 [Ostrea edulis]
MKSPKKKLKIPKTSPDKLQTKKGSEHVPKTEIVAVPTPSHDLSLQEMDGRTPFEDLCSVLEKEKIFPLKKKSLRFPKAKFFCRLCDYHMDAVEDCKKHCRDSRHKRRNEISKFESKLKNIPCPSTRHLAALNEMLERIYTEEGLSEGDVQYREELTRTLQDKLTKDEQLQDVKLVLYGSSLSTTGIKDSNVNIDLVVPQRTNQAKSLTHAFKMMKTLEEYKDVQSNFSSKVPCVLFTDSERGLTCQLTIGSELARETNLLLLMYTKCDPRFRRLAVVFRYWAQICRVDRQTEGTVPAFCFSLMTVYFMQQLSSPVLPILETYEEDTKSHSKKAPAPKHLNVEQALAHAKCWHSQNTESVGSLWLKLLEFYSLRFDHSLNIISVRQQEVLPRAERKWNSKRLAIEDPFSPKRNAARSVKSFELFEYILDCVRISYLYFGLPSNFSNFSDEEQNNLISKARKKVTTKDSVNKKVRSGVSADEEANVKEDEKENSVTESGEMVKREPTNSMSEKATHSVCSEQAVECSVGSHNSSESQEVSKTEGRPTQTETFVVENSISSEHLCQSSSVEEVAKGIVDIVLRNAFSVLHSQCSQLQDDKGKSEKEGKHGLETTHVNKLNNSLPKTDEKLDYNYEFTLDTLSDGKGPKVLCVVCEKEGHLKMNCPEDTLPELRPLPPMTKEHLKLVTEVMKQVPKDFAPSREEIRERESIRRELEQFIQELYPTARLELFGSSNNGFGFRHSDLDLCMTFDDLRIPESLNYVDCIEKVTKKLKTHKGLYNVFPITTAKVPIIKFRHRRSQLEGDISLYNLLALHNTRMISLYSMMDSRVKVLGYAFKVFAKICEIGDASRGSLSSYAYILMLIYYLQQCNPPVLPVLQELHSESEKPENVVEGWNAWYFDDIEALPKLWKHHGKNNASVGELWTGLFRFYTEDFKMDECVVCIRQQETLTKFEKLWNGKCIAIEDPFDLSHNLGGGLSRKMHQYIVKAFVHGRLLYCTPVNKIPTVFSSPADFFFDKTRLTEGSPPNDRGCRVCNKIGHIAKECPIVLNRKEREEKERERRLMEEKNAAGKLELFNQQREMQLINSQQRDYLHNQNSHQREYPHNQNSHQREHPRNHNNQQGNNIPRAYRRSNSESQDYSPHTRQSLHRQPSVPQYQPGYMSPTVTQRDSRPLLHNPPTSMSQPYRPRMGLNITGPPSHQQLYRMPPRNQDPRMHQTRSHGSSMQVHVASPTINLHERPWIQEHMTHPYNSRTSNHNPEVTDGSAVGFIPTNNSNLFYNVPAMLGQPLFLNPSHQGTQLLQGQFPGYQQVLSPLQVASSGLEQGRIVNPRNQMNLGITVQNEYFRGGNAEQQRFTNPQYRGQTQLNRPSPRK